MDKTFMEELIKQTLVELEKHEETWKKRFKEYIENNPRNSSTNDSIKEFKNLEELSFYTSLTQKKNVFNIRHNKKHKNLAEIKYGKGKKIKSLIERSDKEFAKDCKLFKDNGYIDLNSEDAQNFITLLENLSIEKMSKEHSLENYLLREFRKSKGSEKKIRNIQPVLRNGLFFQMPTPFKASSHKPIFADFRGGRIDIMARIIPHRLCICEIKDENKESETQAAAMSQAVIYATFIAKLLTTDSRWFPFFSAQGKEESGLDEHIIEVITIMPKEDEKRETFDNEILDIQKIDPNIQIKLYCRALYVEEITDKDGKKDIKFSGSFLNDIKP